MDLSGFYVQLNRFAVRLEQFCTKLTHVMQFPAVTYEQMFNRPVLQIIAKDCLLTLVNSRLALGSPGWLVGWLFFTMPKMGEYTEK